ncbi:MAG: hypothetical protein H8E98_01655 [Bacteroidetes bacterium]|nr:hypothetical protein [Bacteroidota bacterium]
MKRNFPIVIFSIILIGIVIFLFIFTKSSVSSFTHDESYTYLNYPHDSFMDIVSFKQWYSNNHLLNSLFMKFSEQIFGCSEIALRLPNLLLLLVFMAYGFSLFRKTNQLLALAMFALLCSNNALIDLFGLARGYGLSYGFMLMSLYHFIQSFYKHKTKNIIFFHAAALLAVLSHFTLLTFYATLVLVYNLIVIIDCKFISNKNYHFLKENKVHAISLLPVIIILYEPIRRLLMNNSFDAGGKNGFYSDTVAHLVNNSLHSIQLPLFVLIGFQILFTVIVIISFIIIVRIILSRNETDFHKFKGLIVTNFLIIFMSIAIILLHYIFGSDYPIDRFSVFLYPIFIVHFGYLLYYFINIGYEKIALTVAVSLGLISAVSFGLKADLYSYPEWKYDMETKNMIQKLVTYQEKNDAGVDKIKLGTNWVFEPTINYYRQTQGIDWLIPADRNGITENDDYYYIFKDELKQLNPADYEVIFEFDEINTVLLKNNKQQ